MNRYDSIVSILALNPNSFFKLLERQYTKQALNEDLSIYIESWSRSIFNPHKAKLGFLSQIINHGYEKVSFSFSANDSYNPDERAAILFFSILNLVAKLFNTQDIMDVSRILREIQPYILNLQPGNYRFSPKEIFNPSRIEAFSENPEELTFLFPASEDRTFIEGYSIFTT